jgi:hypothetical protein
MRRASYNTQRKPEKENRKANGAADQTCPMQGAAKRSKAKNHTEDRQFKAKRVGKTSLKNAGYVNNKSVQEKKTKNVYRCEI